MPDILNAWTALNAGSAQVLFCDLQPQIVARSRTTDPKALGRSAGVLLCFAQLFDLPTTFSVAPEGGKEPELIEELRGNDDFAPSFPRVSASPFLDSATADRLGEAKRKVLIVAGFATEAVVLHGVMDALERGYQVLVPVDACGGISMATEAAVPAPDRGGRRGYILRGFGRH